MNYIEIFLVERDPDEMYHWSKLRLCITSFRSLFEAAAQFYNNQEDYPEGGIELASALANQRRHVTLDHRCGSGISIMEKNIKKELSH